MLSPKLRRFLPDERGLETLEYALIAGLIAIAALFVYLEASPRTTLRDRLTESTTAGERGRCPNPPCGEPPPCERPPCGKDK